MTRHPQKQILDGPVRKLQEKTRVLNAMLGKMEANCAFPQLVVFSYVALVCLQLSIVFFQSVFRKNNLANILVESCQIIPKSLSSKMSLPRLFSKKTNPGGGFKHFLFSPLVREDFQFDLYFSDGLKPPTRPSCETVAGFHLGFLLLLFPDRIGSQAKNKEAEVGQLGMSRG